MNLFESMPLSGFCWFSELPPRAQAVLVQTWPGWGVRPDECHGTGPRDHIQGGGAWRPGLGAGRPPSNSGRQSQLPQQQHTWVN